MQLHNNLAPTPTPTQQKSNPNTCTISGLHIRLPPYSLPHHTLIYIGNEDTTTTQSRQLFNILLYCTPHNTQNQGTWCYKPITESLSTNPSSNTGINRFLNRRFYVVQKARVAVELTRKLGARVIVLLAHGAMIFCNDIMEQ